MTPNLISRQTVPYIENSVSEKMRSNTITSRLLYNLYAWPLVEETENLKNPEKCN